MLGNVKPVIKNLSDEDREKYSAYYCGLCDTLGRRYGQISRMALSYDMAFIAIVCDALNGEDFSTTYKGCIANPFKKKNILKATKGTHLAADVLVMLAYFKVIDNIQDEKFLKKCSFFLTVPYFHLKYKMAAKRRSELAKLIEHQCRLQPSLENESATIDTVAMPTAIMTRAIFKECVPESSEKKQEILQFGFFFGRVIYLLDALKDMEEDAKEGKFNVFNQMAYSAENAGEECFMALGEMAYWYREADFKQDNSIIENVIFQGLGTNININTKV